jgi:hypothetical protein
MKKCRKTKNLGLNGTEPGVKLNIVFLCNGLIIGESCTSWRDFLFFGHHTFKNKLSKLPIILKERGENELYASNF